MPWDNFKVFLLADGFLLSLPSDWSTVSGRDAGLVAGVVQTKRYWLSGCCGETGLVRILSKSKRDWLVGVCSGNWSFRGNGIGLSVVSNGIGRVCVQWKRDWLSCCNKKKIDPVFVQRARDARSVCSAKTGSIGIWSRGNGIGGVLPGTGLVKSLFRGNGID